MKITFSDQIGSTPAIVRRDTGEIFLNSNTWFTLPEAYRQFILFHEVGHYKLQTTNELEADHYAFNQIAGTKPESLKNTVRTLYGVLPFSTELQGLRLQNMYRLALTYDQAKQPTAVRLAEILKIESDIERNYSHNQQFQEYMTTTRRGKVTDYQFPGYDAVQFSPSVGNWFRDIQIGSAATQPGATSNTPWPTNTNIFTPQATAPGTMAGTQTNTVTSVAVPLDLIPDYAVPFRIDLKSLAIGILIILAIIGIQKV